MPPTWSSEFSSSPSSKLRKQVMGKENANNRINVYIKISVLPSRIAILKAFFSVKINNVSMVLNTFSARGQA